MKKYRTINQSTSSVLLPEPFEQCLPHHLFEIVPEMWMMDAKEVEEAQMMRSCSNNNIITISTMTILTMPHAAGGGTGNNSYHHA